MSGPLIPYIPGHAYEIPLSFIEYIPVIGSWVDPARPPSIKPFGTLVAIGVYAGSMVTMKRTRDRGLDDRRRALAERGCRERRGPRGRRADVGGRHLRHHRRCCCRLPT